MWYIIYRLLLKCVGTRAETRFRLLAKRMSPFKSAGASVQSTTVSRGVRISGSNAGYTMFRGSVKGIGYPLYSPVSPSLPRPCVTVCHHVSTEFYFLFNLKENSIKLVKNFVNFLFFRVMSLASFPYMILCINILRNLPSLFLDRTSPYAEWISRRKDRSSGTNILKENPAVWGSVLIINFV